MAKSIMTLVHGPSGVTAVYAGETLVAVSKDGYHAGDYLPVMRGYIDANATECKSDSLTTESRAKMHLHLYTD